MKLIFAVAVVAIAAACAQEPETPASTSLGGVWVSNAHLYSFSDFRLVIAQQSQGLVNGTWTGKSDTGTGCSVAIPCNESGNLLGRNTVSRVEIEILGAGKFDGALVEPTRLRGLFAVGQAYDTITFDRVSGPSLTRMSEGDR